MLGAVHHLHKIEDKSVLLSTWEVGVRGHREEGDLVLQPREVEEEGEILQDEVEALLDGEGGPSLDKLPQVLEEIVVFSG